MSLKTLLPQILTSPSLRSFMRMLRAAGRRTNGRQPHLHAFLEPGEPYSELLRIAAPRLAERYGFALTAHAVAPPERSAAPEPEKLAAFSREDAAVLARHYGLEGEDPAIDPEGDPQAGAKLRRQWGHYGAGMLYFEGEWYWGLDSIHHLERRMGAAEEDLLFPPPVEPETATPGGRIEVFLSLRSPYSYLAVMRMYEQARAWGAEIVLRPVLPMVMRSLPVPRAKRFYIVRDCKREAERLGLPFGKIADPVGKGVERGLAVLLYADRAGKGEAFLKRFMTGVWSRGEDPARDAVLYAMAKEAGVQPETVRAALSDESWRAIVEENREALFEAGLWGVPSFRVGEKITFGQDRLWRVGRWLNGQD
jgi:2-hydroxychromene-2-carboxylate isomerase